jgi:hypothetical protein
MRTVAFGIVIPPPVLANCRMLSMHKNYVSSLIANLTPENNTIILMKIGFVGN